ncbi:acetyl-CoA synthetase-like protein, partial [Panus rudis PR-1116 ss-1]
SSAATMKVPPLDGSIPILPGFTDFHAEHNFDQPNFLFPSRSNPNETDSISFRQFAKATHRMAHLLRPNRRGKDGEGIALLVNCDTLLYAVLVVGAVRAGLIPFPMSPRNSAEAVFNMLQKTDCHQIVSQPSLSGLISKVTTLAKSSGYDVEAENLVPLDMVIPGLAGQNDTEVEPYPSIASGKELDDVVLYLHSSGSTGFPKPVAQTNRRILQRARFPVMDETIKHRIRWAAMTLPTFHTMGFYLQVFTPMVSGVPVAIYTPQAPAPPVIPTPQNVFDVAKLTGCTGIPVVPSYLEVWAHSDEAIKFLAKLDVVMFAGGPLSEGNGGKLTKAGVKLFPVYGGTEFGATTRMLDTDDSHGLDAPDVKTSADWAWMQFIDLCKTRWIPQGDGTFELQFLTCETHELSVENLTNPRGYATADLFIPHPTKKGLWRIVGRLDDVVTLSTGEKIVPIPQENYLVSTPYVSGAVIFGRGRSQAGVLIEPRPDHAVDPSDEAAVIAFRNKIWPAVEEANKLAPTFSRIFKEMILITDPAKPLPRAAKGTVMRKLTLQSYEQEIEAFLSATFLRNRIIGALKSSRDVAAQEAARHVPQDFIFVNPTIQKLAAALTRLLSPSDEYSGTSEEVSHIQEMISKYSSQLPSLVIASDKTSSTDTVILLTGSTGSLGSEILASLLSDKRISTVYTLNRQSRTPDRQRSMFAIRGLSAELLSHPKLKPLTGDLSRGDLGLEPKALDQLRNSVTHVIHNAWKVDFNLSLSSFELHVANTCNLLRATAAFTHRVKFLFTSSIAVARRWDASQGPIPETPLSTPEAATGSGYGSSKYAVEQLLAQARKQGLETTSLRIGQISGSTTSGAWSVTEWLPILVKSSIALKCLPDANIAVSWIPSDTLSKAILDLVTTDKALPDILNMVHPRPASWIEVFGRIGSALGNLPVVPLKDWFEKLENLSTRATSQDLESIPALKLLSFFQDMAESSSSARGTKNSATTSRFETRKSEAFSPTLRNAPPFSDHLVALWLQFWRDNGFISDG